MTVSYQNQVASSTSGGFTRLLLMWRGSLYKLIYRELLLFLLLFGAVSAIYRLILSPTQKKDFEKIVIYCDYFINLIPLSFVLGFYVSYVAQRWWKQYQAIPWPDKVMHLVALYVTGNDKYSRMLRRSLMRYLNLSLILVLRSISSAVKKRFPTLDHVVDSGFMTSLELELFQSVPSLEFNTYWIPCTWLINLLKEARRNERIPDPQGLKLIMEEFNEFRTKCGLLWSFDWISIPLVYTQVVTLATYSFFAVALFARQYIDGTAKQFQLEIDTYIPVFTVLQFFFFMGLLKVAEQLINPFGDDDEDFELNWLIDRHTKVSYLGVDTLMNRCPPLVKDIFFDAENLILPYTEAAAAYKKKTYRGSVANMMVPEKKQTMFLPEVIEEDETEKVTPTHHTSTISLAIHSDDSPSFERRQISGHPETCSKTDQNCPETVVQLDIQESPARDDEKEQRRVVTETMKKISSVKHSPSRVDPNRKPFFTLTKTPKVLLQPWPSATNLSRFPKQFVDTPTVYGADTNLWKDFNPKASYPFTLDTPTSEHSPEVKEHFDLDIISQSDLFSANTRDSPCSEAGNSQQHSPDVLHLQLPETKLPLIMKATIPRHRIPKHNLGRHNSIVSSKKKGIQWKEIMRIRRRKATSDVPPVEIVLSHTKSSPNLRHLGVNSESPMKDIPDDKLDLPDKDK